MAQNTPENARVKSHIKDIVLLFAIPVGIALLAAAVIYIPRLLANPKYDFVYAVCEDYRCGESYTVDAGHVVKESNPAMPEYYVHTTHLMYYNAAADSTRSITLEEAQQHRLDASSKSPDGYTLSWESSNTGFLFWGHADSGWYLKNGAKKKRVELANSNSYYYSQNVTFLGWVNK